MTVDSLDVADPDLSATCDGEVVAAYLLDHPNFFEERPELLGSLQLSHGQPGSVSLIERQVALLRDENADMRKQLTDLHSDAERNEKLFMTTRALTLDLLGIASPDVIGKSVTHTLYDSLDVSLCSLLWLPAADFISASERVAEPRAAVLEALVRHGNSLCGVLRQAEMSALFDNGRDEAGDASGLSGGGSAALAPIQLDDQIVGILAVGDHDPTRYQAGDGTLFLDYLTEIIARLLPVRHHHES